jgi:hypothetical protein
MNNKTYIDIQGNIKEIDLEYILCKYHIKDIEELDDFLSEMLLKSSKLSKIKITFLKLFNDIK